MELVPVIGLEVHAQLSTQTKIFCGCATAFGAEPNHHTCPVCLGMPGVLPVLNRRAVELAVRTGLALGCSVRETSQWARKNYFYPDLPKGYQISQFELPVCEGGSLTFDLPDGQARTVRLKRIHLEEDAGKNVHTPGATSLVDFNRAGVPLMEIVSEPDLASPEEASEYLKALHDVVVALDACNGNMEQGNFRCDANVSVMPRGSTVLGTRAELKNINSFRFVREALEFEIARQVELVSAGQPVVQETRLYDPDRRRTYSMRSKEESHDYRYFPDPDLQPLTLAPGMIDELRRALPELPRDRMLRLERQHGLSREDARALSLDVHPAVAALFDAVVARYPDAKKAANWFRGELFRALNEGQADAAALKPTPEALVALLGLVDRGAVSLGSAKEVFSELLAHGGDPAAIVQARGLGQVSDSNAIEQAVDQVLAANPDEVAKYRAGRTQLLGFFTGQVMRAMKGKANPAVANALLAKKLGG